MTPGRSGWCCALPSLDGYLRTGLDDLIESASQASMILLRTRALHRCFPVAWRSQNRPGAGNASGWRPDGALERASSGAVALLP